MEGVDKSMTSITEDILLDKQPSNHHTYDLELHSQHQQCNPPNPPQNPANPQTDGNLRFTTSTMPPTCIIQIIP